MTNWQMIHPGLQLRHEQPLKEMSLKIGREMFTPKRKLLNLFSNRGTNCLNEYFLNARTGTSKDYKMLVRKVINTAVHGISFDSQ